MKFDTHFTLNLSDLVVPLPFTLCNQKILSGNISQHLHGLAHKTFDRRHRSRFKKVSTLLAKVQVWYTGNQSAEANKSKKGKAKAE